MLDLNHLFIPAIHDTESAQLRILSELQKLKRSFGKFKIYPDLINLTNFLLLLKKINETTENLEQAQKWEGEYSNLELERITGVIKWALPLFRETASEGIMTYDFVNDNIKMDTVGLVSPDMHNGYMFICSNNEVKVLLFDYIPMKVAGEKTIMLKTKKVASTIWPIDDLIDLKSDLTGGYSCTAFSFHSDIDFPYTSALYPISKRKLVHHIYKEDNS